jgi:hypothetical protein
LRSGLSDFSHLPSYPGERFGWRRISEKGEINRKNVEVGKGRKLLSERPTFFNIGRNWNMGIFFNFWKIGLLEAATSLQSPAGSFSLCIISES